MHSVIKFENVSKRYKLGLTRTSLPSVVSGWLRYALKSGSQKSHGDEFLWALKDVSFKLTRGQSMALVGPNGAGKTTILKLLANILGIPSPKEDMDGSMVRDVYYEEGDINRIVRYCELDVITLAQVFLRLRNDNLLTEDQIFHI